MTLSQNKYSFYDDFGGHYFLLNEDKGGRRRAIGTSVKYCLNERPAGKGWPKELRACGQQQVCYLVVAFFPRQFERGFAVFIGHVRICAVIE